MATGLRSSFEGQSPDSRAGVVGCGPVWRADVRAPCVDPLAKPMAARRARASGFWAIRCLADLAASAS